MLLEVAHESGRGFSGLFDFRERASVPRIGGELVSEELGVGGDDAEKIIQGVGDDLIFGEGHGHSAGIVEGNGPERIPFENRLELTFIEDRGEGRAKGIRGEARKRKRA